MFFLTLIGLMKKMPQHHYYLEEQDKFNWEDVANQLMRRCNFADSLEGTLFLNFIINRIYDMPLKWISALFPMIVVLEVMDWFSMVNSTVNIAYSINVQLSRLDFYNSSKVFGKFLKIVFQLYMKGFLSKKKLVKESQIESLVEM